MQDIANICDMARAVIETEASAISHLIYRIDEQFERACEHILNCSGRIIVIGIGKSGHIGKKIAATFASTGSPAFFVHPGEANHGDIGMITQKDVVLALSYSGETAEMLSLLPYIKRLGIPLLSMTGNSQSSLATASDVHLDVSVAKEACPLGLAPTASTTATLVMGDALAIALLQTRGFTAEDFALSHPGGSLGRRLLLCVDQIMHSGPDMPKVNEEALLKTALVEMTQKKLGMTTIVNKNNTLSGIFTDGDLRRVLDDNIDIHHTLIHQVMTTNPKTILIGTLAAKALRLMETHKITALVITNEQQNPLGIIHLHDIVRAGIIA